MLFSAPDHLDKLLLGALRVEPEVEPVEPQQVEILLHRALAHNVQPLVVEALSARFSAASSGDAPEEVRQRLHRLLRGWTARYMVLESQLDGALEILHAGGIEALVLKGPAIGRAAYPRPELRAFSDLDILVPSKSFLDALHSLTGHGFRVEDLSKSRRYHRVFHYHDVLVTPGGQVMELHWGLSRPDDLFRLETEPFFAHAVTVGPHRRDTGPTEMLLHSAAQGLSDGFDRLSRIVDADRLVRFHGEAMDWDRLCAAAGRGGLGPSLWLHLSLARDIFDTPVPTAVESLRPRGLSRAALASLTPAETLTGGISLEYPNLRKLYAVWLSVGLWSRVRALARMVRLQRMMVSLRGEDPGWKERAAAQFRRIVSFFKLAGFQAARLAVHPFRRAGKNHRRPS